MTPSLSDLLATRHSARAFTDQPVSSTLINEVFTKAQRSPSWCNTQPWQVHVLSGDAATRLSELLGQAAASQPQSADLGLPVYTGEPAMRRRESGYALYEALGIAREDKQARMVQMFKNFSFFGAPHTAILTTDRDLGQYGVLDCGTYLGTLMLLLQDAGLGVIAQGAIAMYSDVVRDFLDLPEQRQVVCAISFGHEDSDDPVNDFRTSRADVGDVVHHVTD